MTAGDMYSQLLFHVELPKAFPRNEIDGCRTNNGDHEDEKDQRRDGDKALPVDGELLVEEGLKLKQVQEWNGSRDEVPVVDCENR